jgi:hypothetical protein
VGSARGGTVRHHLTFELALPDGSRLRTRISRPADKRAYGPSLWATILRDQLSVTQAEFWGCVVDGAPPRRGRPTSPGPEAIPAAVVHHLVHEVGLTEVEVAALTREQAIQRLNEYWTLRE